MVIAGLALALFAAAQTEFVSLAVLLFAAWVRAAAAFIVSNDFLTVDDNFFNCVSIEVVVVLI